MKKTIILGMTITWLLAACSNVASTTLPSTPMPPTVAPPPSTNTAISATPTNEPSPVEFVWSISGEPNALDMPTDLVANAQGNLYILDAGNDRVQVFDSKGQFVTMWGKTGNGPGEFNFRRADGYSIGALALDRQGNIYVADNGNQRIQKFDDTGIFLMEWGNKGTEDGQFLSPIGVAVDEDGNVYIVDDARDDIQKFDRTGTFLLKWGSHGFEDGQFNYSGRLAIDPQGDIYVADFANHRIQKFNSQGVFLAKWGVFGEEQGQFNDPAALAIDPQGNIYVIEYAAHPPATYRVQVFDGKGNFLWTWGGPGIGNGEFIHPLGIAVDHQGNIYVSDETNRVQKFLQKRSLTVEELVGSWKDVDGYIEFKPDGTWAFATTLDALKAGTLYVEGTFSVAGDEITILDDICGDRTGVYQLATKTENKLTFTQVNEECVGQRRLPFLERIP